MTALDIITQARERLGDLKEQRWSDNRLLSIVSQGQTDICIETGFIRKQVILPLVENETDYILPSDCVVIKRVEYNNLLLPIHTRSDKDVPRAVTSDFVAYKSNLNTDRIEIQPAVTTLTQVVTFLKGEQSDEDFQVTPLYGVVTSTDSTAYLLDTPYGVIIDAELDITGNDPSDGYGEIAGTNNDDIIALFPDGEYGVTIEADFIATKSKYGFLSAVDGHIVSGFHGVTTSVAVQEDTFKVFYVASPTKLRYVSAILALPERWEALLLRYVVGTALQDDNDANNIQRGELEIAKYDKQLATLKDMSSKDFSAGASDKYTTNYRRI